MSAAEVRAALAAAASTVDGINCSAYYRQSTKAGDAMVRRNGTNYPNSLGGVITWQVLINMPTDLAAAQRFLDDVVPLVVAALEDVLQIRSVTPQQLQYETGLVPGAVIEGLRAEDD